MTTAAESGGAAAVTERFGLKMLVEACLVLEEGVAGIKDVDLGMMAGAGIMPGPFARADEQGLDEALAALERARSEWGERFEPPTILRRLVAQGRLGRKSGQGFFAYPRPDDEARFEHIAVETRADGVAILWLNRPPANPLSPAVVRELAEAWRSELDGRARAVVVASASPFTFSAGADIKEFTKMDPPSDGADLLETAHGFMRAMERSRTTTIAAVNSIAFGGGCELAMACDFRLAAESATFGQPEINLGIIPGFGGTQRLPRLIGEGRALELNLTGQPIDAYEAERLGLANLVVPDHELFDTALLWARKLAGQAPLAVEAIKGVSGRADLDEGLRVEGEAFGRVFGSEDAREGIGAFLAKRQPRFEGR